ncbi:hypothetical protein FACS189413_02300 [Bacteroidia bacterium]|nr:hypothetical protein FACS189413_02300 [Bacteroidia bacterium]
MSNLSAKDVYLSSTGDDDNDGSTPELAVATLQTAYNLIPVNNKNGHIIHVSGFIDITTAVNMTNTNQTVSGVNDGSKYLTIDGGDSITSGFDGGNSIQLINLQGNKGSITFRNLTFRNGNGSGNGVIRLLNNNLTQPMTFEKCHFYGNTSGNSSSILHNYNSQVIYDDCEFDNNTGTNRGGVFYIAISAIVTIKNSRIHDNFASNSSSAIYIDNAGNTTIQASYINNNRTTTTGGVIYQTNSGTLTIQSTNFTGNASANTNNYVIDWNGDALTLINCQIQNNTIAGLISRKATGTLSIDGSLFKGNSSTARGGGVYSLNQHTLIKNSAFINNSTSLQGGALSLAMGNSNCSFKMINSTVAQNSSTGYAYGTAMYVSGYENNTNEYLFDNVTFTENNSIGAAGTWNTSALYFYTEGYLFSKVRIYNSIFENNLASDNTTSRDIAHRLGKDIDPSTEDGEFLIKNSIIASFYSQSTNIADAVNSAVGGKFTFTGQAYKPSGLGAFNSAGNYYPLTSATQDATHYATNLGNASYLLDAKSQSDQTGTTRKNIARGIVDAGAVEYTLPEYVIADEAGTSTDYKAGTYGDIIFTDGDDFTVAGGDEAGSNYYGVKYKKTVEAGKWYALGFPFDVVGFYCEDFEYGKPGDDGEGPVLAIYNGTDVGDFFVKTLEDGTGDDYHEGYHFAFHNENKLDAGVGYIVRFPLAFDEKEITFVSDFHPALSNNAQISTIADKTYTLVANPSVASTTPTSAQSDFYYYALNDDNEFERTTATIAPFEAFVGVTGIAPESILRAIAIEQQTDTPTDIQRVNSNDKIVATQYYNLMGQAATPTTGVYIVKQIYESGKSEVSKIIRK